MVDSWGTVHCQRWILLHTNSGSKLIYLLFHNLHVFCIWVYILLLFLWFLFIDYIMMNMWCWCNTAHWNKMWSLHWLCFYQVTVKSLIPWARNFMVWQHNNLDMFVDTWSILLRSLIRRFHFMNYMKLNVKQNIKDFTVIMSSSLGWDELFLPSQAIISSPQEEVGRWIRLFRWVKLLCGMQCNFSFWMRTSHFHQKRWHFQ